MRSGIQSLAAPTKIATLRAMHLLISTCHENSSMW
jgi:hypothetical protein